MKVVERKATINTTNKLFPNKVGNIKLKNLFLKELSFLQFFSNDH
jgi:hypothetical protein